MSARWDTSASVPLFREKSSGHAQSQCAKALAKGVCIDRSDNLIDVRVISYPSPRSHDVCHGLGAVKMLTALSGFL